MVMIDVQENVQNGIILNFQSWRRPRIDFKKPRSNLETRLGGNVVKRESTHRKSSYSTFQHATAVFYTTTKRARKAEIIHPQFGRHSVCVCV